MNDQAEKELQRLAKKLGGAWRIENGVMPLIVLTVPEAQAVEARFYDVVKSDPAPDGEHSNEGDPVKRQCQFCGGWFFVGREAEHSCGNTDEGRPADVCPNCGAPGPPNWPEINELECNSCGYTEIVDPRNRRQEP